MTNSPYRAGVVGCGTIGQDHARGYREHENVELVAVADLDPAAAQAVADESDGVSTYKDHREMLADASLDLYSVATDHDTHAMLTIDGAEAGVRGIVCEKPMAVDLGEAKAMRTAADRNDVHLTIGHQNRFAPAHERGLELIAEGAIGTPQAITARAGGGLINNGTHFIDLGRFLVGDPDPTWCAAHVERSTDRYERGVPAEDSCVGRVSFDTDLRLTIETDTPSDLPTDGHLVVQGSDGVMTVDYGRSIRVAGPDGVNEYAPDSDRRRRVKFIDELLSWIEGERDGHRCSGAESIVTLEIMMGLYESVRTDQVVEFPLETRANPLHVMIEEGELPPSNPGAYDIRHPYASVRRD